MLQSVFDSIHHGGNILLEIGIERFIHATEQSRRNCCATELAIFDGVDPRGHPSTADKGLVRFSLILDRTLYRGFIEPDIRNMKASEHAVWRWLPGDPEQDGLPIESFLSTGRPDALVDEIRNTEPLAATPDTGGGVEGYLLLTGLVVFAFLQVATGDDHPLVVLEVHFLQLPDFTLALAMTGFVFKEEHMILGGKDSRATVARVFLFIVHRQHRHNRNLWVRWKKSTEMQHSAEGDIP